MLVGGEFGDNHIVFEQRRFGARHQPFALEQPGERHQQGTDAGDDLCPVRADAEDPERQPGNAKIERAKGQAGRHQAQMRDHQQRKGQRGNQRPDVIHAQNVFKAKPQRADLLQEPRDERDLHAREHAD